jgi:hypothetical protein
VRDFYQPYKESIDELHKLRQAHAILIGMIQNQQITVGGPFKQQQEKMNSSWGGNQRQTQSDFSLKKITATSSGLPKGDNVLFGQKKMNNTMTGINHSFTDFMTCGSMLGGKNALT